MHETEYNDAEQNTRNKKSPTPAIPIRAGSAIGKAASVGSSVGDKDGA
jgi:hypothetical protein